MHCITLHYITMHYSFLLNAQTVMDCFKLTPFPLKCTIAFTFYRINFVPFALHCIVWFVFHIFYRIKVPKCNECSVQSSMLMHCTAQQNFHMHQCSVARKSEKAPAKVMNSRWSQHWEESFWTIRKLWLIAWKVEKYLLLFTLRLKLFHSEVLKF